MSYQAENVAFSVRHQLICIVLSVVLIVTGMIPRTDNEFIDSYTQPKQADAAVPVAAVAVFGTVLAVAGVAVAGYTASEYAENLGTALVDFLNYTGMSSKEWEALAIASTLSTAQIVNIMYLEGMFPSVFDWASASEWGSTVVDSPASAVKPIYTLDSIPIPFMVVDWAPGFVDQPACVFTYNGHEYAFFPARYTTDKKFNNFIFSDSNNGITSSAANIATNLKVCILVGGKWKWITTENAIKDYDAGGLHAANNAKYNYSNGAYWPPHIHYDLVSNLRLVVGTRELSIHAPSKLGTWNPETSAFDFDIGVTTPEVSGGVVGVFNGSAAAGADVALPESVNVYNPSDADLAQGITYEQVLDLLNSNASAPELDLSGVIEALGSFWANLYEFFTVKLPAILVSVFLPFIQVLPHMWDWLQNLPLTDYFSKVLDFIGTLNPAAWWDSFWSWVGNLDLVNWLAKVWDWIQSLGLSAALEAIKAAIESLTLEGVLDGILEGILNFPATVLDAFLAALTSFFVPDLDALDLKLAGLQSRIFDKFGISFDFGSLVPGERPIEGIEGTFNFGGHTFTSKVFNPDALLVAIADNRSIIRGFTVVLLIFFFVNEVMHLMGSAGLFAKGQQALNESSGKSS